MSKKRFKRGRLRLQVLRILVVSFVLETIILVFGFLIITLTMSESDKEIYSQAFEEVNVFAQGISEGIDKDVDDIKQIYMWDGWDEVDQQWTVQVYNGSDELVYEKGNTNIMFDSIISVSLPLSNFEDAHLVVIANISQPRTVFQGISMILGLVVFITLFTLQFRRIEKYTYEIADGIGILAGGELNYRIPIRGRNELSMLASHINEMAYSLKKQGEEKKKSEAARDELITNVAHDIRTPITVLEGYLSMLISEQNMKASKRREYMQISLEKCRELSDRADNIFEFVRLNSDSEKIKATTVHAKSYISQRFEEMAMILSGDSFKCDVDIRISDFLEIDIDKNKMQRVFDNLLSNILKYADNTQAVVMKAEVHASYIIASVKNRMINPLEIEPERLFERMISGDKSRSSKSTGLGLSICKVIMSLHSGDISAAVTGKEIEFTLKFLKNN